MGWYDVGSEYHKRTFNHDGRLSSLPADWQRELAAVWRLEVEVNNGAYLQFLTNWGKEAYVYASLALRRIGARKMAEIVDQCQALVDEHFTVEGKSQDELRSLLPNQVVGRHGETIKAAGSVLPESVIARIYELSYEFMDYPEDIAQLGLRHYAALIRADTAGLT